LYLISAYVQWVIGHRFDDIAPITSLRNIKKPVLCVHGTADRLIPLSDHHLLCQSTDSPLVVCHQVVGADHDSIDLIDQHFSVLQNFIAHSLVPKQ
jgi:pimeloyl-ACP methyl ester carboxylesterase